MQTWIANITNIQPIEGKDRIVLATVNGYQAIVGKDTYQLGEEVVYISEQSIIPDTLQEELGLVGRLAGGNKDRVKAIRMGGVLSQGIVCQPQAWVEAGKPNLTSDMLDGLLQVAKWEPTIPLSMSGKVARPRGNAPICPMYDIENIKKQRHLRFEHDPITGETIGDGVWFDPFHGETVTVTEKLHGTNFAVHLNREEDGTVNTDNVYIYSKGLGKHGHVLLEDANNVYWKAFRKNPDLAAWMGQALINMAHVDSITVRGEVVGTGIQDLTYGVEFELAIFSIEYHTQGVTTAVHPDETSFPFDIGTIPILYQGVYDYDLCVELSQGDNIWGVPDLHVREGVVVTHAYQYRQLSGDRFAAKFINPDYLTRKGGTEFN